MPTKHPHRCFLFNYSKLRCREHRRLRWMRRPDLLVDARLHTSASQLVVAGCESPKSGPPAALGTILYSTLINRSATPAKELMDVNSKYVIGDKEIGSGHYGVVRTCTSRGELKRVALPLPRMQPMVTRSIANKQCLSFQNKNMPYQHSRSFTFSMQSAVIHCTRRFQLRVEVSMHAYEIACDIKSGRA